MNKNLLLLAGLILALLGLALDAFGVTFTNNAYIGVTNSSLDGQDIVVTNAVLTMDGMHTFNSLEILDGGVLTHTFSSNGLLSATIPVTNETHTITDTNPATLDRSNVDTNSIVVTDMASDTVYTNGSDYLVTTLTNQFAQLSLTTNSTIPEGATVLVNYNWTNILNAGFQLLISNNAFIAVGGAINVSGRGCAGGIGFENGAGASQSTNYPYPFTAGAGGGHGGLGGMSSTFASGGSSYDSYTNSDGVGGGGGLGSGAGGAGGGAVQLIVGDALEVDGQILADGLEATNGHAGGGAGGSIYLSAQVISGAGTISADGGAGEPADGGGGGGGRIAVYYATNDFTGHIVAQGGHGFEAGGAGTIYLQSSASIPALGGTLLIANGGARGANTVLNQIGTNSLIVTGGAVVQCASGKLNLSSLLIGLNSLLTAPAQTNLQCLVSGDAVIESNAAINLDSRGYPANSGPGSGFVSGSDIMVGRGGSHGGSGGQGLYYYYYGGASYGDFQTPVELGSGGGSVPVSGSAGGGSLQLTVGGTLSLSGTITANGGDATVLAAGGGSGGSVYLTAGRFTGTGSISANGGAGADDLGGGGGGGRVAVYSNTNNFTGSITAHGGVGYVAGGAGTIYLAQSSDNLVPNPPSLLILDNGGLSGTNTPVLGSVLGSDILRLNLTVTGGAIGSVAPYSDLFLPNLFIGSNSWITVESPVFGYGNYSPLSIAATNATIQSGGGITTDGESFGDLGPGGNSYLSGGGGGHGGYGGAGAAANSYGPYPNGGNTYDSITSPSNPGSAGGNPGGDNYRGSAGGGVIHLVVSGMLQLNGTISANGLSAAPQDANAGGASGGAIWLEVGTLSGAGIISANGSAGIDSGGGGGGGRIAIYYSTNLFSGSLTAAGGMGTNDGGAGTIYLASTNHLSQQLIVSNGGAPGTNTPILLYSQGHLDLTVTGGATASNGVSSVTFANLFVGSNSTFITSPLQMLTVLTNATIQSGGRISVDGLSANGPGNGGFSGGVGGGGGGGHGGYGGSGIGITTLSPPAPGGNSYDFITSPTAEGSRGGTGTGDQGGNGGGALHMTVNGTLDLDGAISADGAAGSVNSGGGSGGAIWLQTRAITGNGTLSANGGAGGNNLGGGGGGGRIAVYFDTNQFTGSITACGGPGYVAGGAGTIYLSPTSGQIKRSKLLVDNGGLPGTNTPIFNLTSLMDLTIDGGAAAICSISTLSSSSFQYVNSLVIASNASLSATGILHLTVSSNAVIRPGGVITLDGRGFMANHGLGAGSEAYNGTAPVGGGGGHGGNGSTGSIPYAVGGSSYDLIAEPSSPGSGGGSSSTNGSAGGGALMLTVNGTLEVDGNISVNGLPWAVPGAGGGAGGSLWLSAGTFAGSGTISADGGAGEEFGGGGGGAGGRIAVYFNTNQFNGIFSAKGGAGFNLAGGAGTIYLAPKAGQGNNFQSPQLLVDNGGASGADTPLGSIYDPGQNATLVALKVGDGAVATTSLPLTLQSFDIAPGGTLRANPTNALEVSVLSDALVDSNGAIRADAAGYGLTNGLGAGGLDSMGNGGGGGYGGPGGASVFGAPGGSAYGSPGEPSDFGSPGGMSPALDGFSQGGGAIRLTVAGALALKGVISANGNDGVIEGAGGGAGGSIWITTQKLSGQGLLQADGGAGEAWQGGGGGGGRIAVYAATNFFAGMMSAWGGMGAWPGQDGSLVMSANLVISGNIFGTNGIPVAGVGVQANGKNVAVSDAHGNYSVAVPLFWNGTLAPSNGGSLFLPALRTYSALASDAVNQNFIAASPGAFDLASSQLQEGNLSFNWYGIAGVVYQPLYSTNLVEWLPYGPRLTGSNAPIVMTLPVTNAPQLFFRLSASY